jgi:hypothetical protein
MLRMPFRPRGRLRRIYRQSPGDLRQRSRVAVPVCYCNTYRKLFDTHGGKPKITEHLPWI